ncbi:MAG: 5'/3'-nucleotidase SurE [Acidobacteria bacterium]|nr:5'/3'-nucleotidase SurE [Acidobacteriota bacterium]
MTVILLTNDDGIEAEGLRALEKVLGDLARLVIVAPDRERSAVSHGLTIHTPLELKELGPDRYVLNGTPADCVIYAIQHLFNVFPDMVVSGINHGANLGDDVMYSGTVAAAREASRHGIPSVALSQAYDDRPVQFKEGPAYARELISTLLGEKANGEFCLNVNFPVRKIRGTRITRQGCAQHIPHFNSLDFNPQYRLLPQSPEEPGGTDLWSDRKAVINQYVSITPMQRDQTDYGAARALESTVGKMKAGF